MTKCDRCTERHCNGCKYDPTKEVQNESIKENSGSNIWDDFIKLATLQNGSDDNRDYNDYDIKTFWKTWEAEYRKYRELNEEKYDYKHALVKVICSNCGYIRKCDKRYVHDDGKVNLTCYGCHRVETFTITE